MMQHAYSFVNCSPVSDVCLVDAADEVINIYSYTEMIHESNEKLLSDINKLILFNLVFCVLFNARLTL